MTCVAMGCQTGITFITMTFITAVVVAQITTTTMMQPEALMPNSHRFQLHVRGKLKVRQSLVQYKAKAQVSLLRHVIACKSG